MRIVRHRAAVTVVVLAALGAASAGRAAAAPAGAELELFTRSGCSRCAAAERFLEALRHERPSLRVAVHDIGRDARALGRLADLARARGVRAVAAPAFLVGGRLVVGFLGPQTTGVRIRALLSRVPGAGVGEGGGEEVGGTCPPGTAPCPEESGSAADFTGSSGHIPADVEAADPESVDAPLVGRLSARALGLPAFTVAIGLVDGFNPCAMWVLLFLLSLLVNLESRPRMLLIGGTFVVVSGLVYFAFMAAWLSIFLLIGLRRPAQVVLGGIAGMIGGLNVKDVFALGRGVSLVIPAAAKPRIYARVRAVLQAEHVPGALLGVGALAVLVNAVELLCTAGLPAIYTQILTLRRLPSWQYYAYLGLYDVAYMLDDALMLAIAVVTLGRRKLEARAGRWLKLVSGCVMLGLGFALLFRPDWLV